MEEEHFSEQIRAQLSWFRILKKSLVADRDKIAGLGQGSMLSEALCKNKNICFRVCNIAIEILSLLTGKILSANLLTGLLSIAEP